MIIINLNYLWNNSYYVQLNDNIHLYFASDTDCYAFKQSVIINIYSIHSIIKINLIYNINIYIYIALVF